MVLPAALVVGLLTFPTGCFCGSETPHSHALFLLSHHDHHAESSAHHHHPMHEHRDHTEHGDDDQHTNQQAIARRATADGQQVSVQVPSREGGVGTPLSVITPLEHTFGSLADAGLRHQPQLIVVSVTLLPDTPPPRLRFTTAA